MKLKLYKVPFIIVLIALPLNWVINLTGIGFIIWTPEILTIMLVCAIILLQKTKQRFNFFHIFLVLIFSLHLVSQIFAGLGTGGSAVLSIILLSMIFAWLMHKTNKSLINIIIDQINIIYTINILFIIFEICMINADNIDFLAMLAGGEYKPAYSYYQPVPQSLIKNSQAASQLCLFSATWFTLLFLFRKRLQFNFNLITTFTLISSFIIFFMYPTTTAQIIGIIFILLIIYLIPIFKNSKLRFIVLATGIIFLDKIVYTVSYKFNPDVFHSALHYQNAFLAPIVTFIELPLIYQLSGGGGIEMLKNLGMAHADFGLGVYLLRIGIIMTALGIICLFAPVLRMFFHSFNSRFKFFYSFPWLWLGMTNAILVIGNFVSTSHYTVSFQVGGRALFSLHIAIVLYSLDRLYRINKQTYLSTRSYPRGPNYQTSVVELKQLSKDNK
jgi:hypothetical protein